MTRTIAHPVRAMARMTWMGGDDSDGRRRRRQAAAAAAGAGVEDQGQAVAQLAETVRALQVRQRARA